jgi:hypothetical protein
VVAVANRGGLREGVEAERDDLERMLEEVHRSRSRARLWSPEGRAREGGGG